MKPTEWEAELRDVMERQILNDIVLRPWSQLYLKLLSLDFFFLFFFSRPISDEFSLANRRLLGQQAGMDTGLG